MKRIFGGLCICVFCLPVYAQVVKLQLPADTKEVKYAISPKSKQDKVINLAQVPANYYTHGLGFFCRQELKLQKAHVPVTFRLGNMEQCNYLEQKNVRNK